MVFKQIIKVSKDKIEELQETIDNKELVEKVKTSRLETFTATFANGIKVEIIVCNGNPPFLDYIVFENEDEKTVFDGIQTILGVHRIEFQDNKYIVKLELD